MIFLSTQFNISDPNQFGGQPGYPPPQGGYGQPPPAGFAGYPPQGGFPQGGYPQGGFPQGGFVPHLPPQGQGQPGYQPQGDYNNAYGQGQYGQDEDPEVKGFEFNDESIRKGFIRKVYSILMVSKIVKFVGGDAIDLIN